MGKEINIFLSRYVFNNNQLCNDSRKIEVLRDRLESENIFEAEISPVGEKLVSLKVPTTSKDEIENIRKLLMMSARLLKR